MATFFDKPINHPKIHEYDDRLKSTIDGGWRIDWSKTPGVLIVRCPHADAKKKVETSYYHFNNREWKELSGSEANSVFEDVNKLSFDDKQKRMARYIVTKHVDALIELVCQTKHLKQENLSLSTKHASISLRHKKT